MRFLAIIILYSLSLLAFGQSSLQISTLRCEMLENPMGLTSVNPRVGWELTSSLLGDRQTAYQILVSENLSDLNKEIGNVWNSGKVKSDQSQLVIYQGKPLESGKRYFWKVRAWDIKGKPSTWSSVAFWDMAPSTSFLNAKWIGAIEKAYTKLPGGHNFDVMLLRKKLYSAPWDSAPVLAKRSIMLRKPFSVEKTLKKAIIYICGLGHYELTLNGKKVGDSEFAPLWSDYAKTVYYNIYQVDSLLLKGENVIGVLLGNGMYNVTGNRYRKFLGSYGPPTLFFKMKLYYSDNTEETVISDKSWKYAESPVTFNCIFGGEDYNATLEQKGWDKPGFIDTTWHAALIQDAPDGVMRPQLTPPVKAMSQYSNVSVKKLGNGAYVFNMGQNLSGYPAVKVKGKNGQTVKLIVGETLKEDSFVSQKQTGGSHFYLYTLKGDSVEEWHPRFSYYGYQYIQVEGADWGIPSDTSKPLLLDINSVFIHNSASNIGTFECSNEIFTRTHQLITNAIRSNMQGYFTDCPHREKLGWIEQLYLNGPGLYYNFDLSQLFPKVMRDLADAQLANGLVPSVAPEYLRMDSTFRDSPEWGCASIAVPWMYYNFYGDKSLLEQYYPVMARYVDYLSGKADNFILTNTLGDWFDYGARKAGASQNSPVSLSATAHYFYGASLVAKAARLLGFSGDAKKYATLAEQIKTAYNQKFFHTDTRQYGTGSQYCNAVSLYMNLVEPQNKQAVLENLLSDIKSKNNRLSTGDIGNRYLFQTLAKNNQNEVMYVMHNHYDVPGYGYQLKFGLSTLTENWDPVKGNSRNHFMMGQIEEWFFQSLAGIMPDTANSGFKNFIIRPEAVGDLTYVKASYRSLYGDIQVNWKKEPNSFLLSVKIPVNTSACVYLPTLSSSGISVNNSPLNQLKEIKLLGTENGKTKLLVGSGDYQFKILY
jgi:hypothetical protein